jgi:FtsH-binding integral membrane protein
MSLSVWFWILMAFGLFFGLYAEYDPGHPYPYKFGLRWVFLYLVIVILGIAQFGGPVK